MPIIFNGIIDLMCYHSTVNLYSPNVNIMGHVLAAVTIYFIGYPVISTNNYNYMYVIFETTMHKQLVIIL